MTFFSPQNPGIGGLEELTDIEQTLIQNLALISFSTGDILYYDGNSLVNLAIGTEDQVLAVSASGVPEWVTGGVGGGISNVVEDTTPQLGGNLDLNTFTVGVASAADLTKLSELTATSTELNYVDGVTSAIQTQIDTKAPSTSPTFATSITGSYLTASELLATDGSKNIVSLAVATYPSLTELTYVKGVTSAIQTQLDAKLASSSYDDATAAETDTGTSTTKYVSPDGLAGSYAGTKSISVQVTGGTENVTTGDGKAYITIPDALDGMNLVRAQATVVTAGTTNATTVMIHNKTDAADMLSGAISIASAGTVGTVGTINGAADDVAVNDVLRIDVDSVSTTAPQGLMVILEFRLP